jgi:hypothetical protein
MQKTYKKGRVAEAFSIVQLSAAPQLPPPDAALSLSR